MTPKVLDISMRFLAPDPIFHGQRDGTRPEWPPSPLRLFQALVDASASRWLGLEFRKYALPALEWLQKLQPFKIVTPSHHVGTSYRIAVPNNDWDSPAHVWAKGGEPIKPHRPVDLKTMKAVQPIRLICKDYDDSVLHYLYLLEQEDSPYIAHIRQAARSVTHLGWGVDMAVGDANVITDTQAAQLPGHHWQDSPAGGMPLRIPSIGTLDDLTRKHADFLARFSDDGFRPVQPIRVFDIAYYRHQSESFQRPYRIFELRNTDGTRSSYPHSRLIHVAGMVRHLAIEAMKKSPPPGVDENWVETYIAGHILKGVHDHRQLSYLPLPSIGGEHTNPGVRRIMIAAHIGDDQLLDHIAKRLSGKQLEPKENEFGDKEPPLLIPLSHDSMAANYTRSAKVWRSFTPIILPGHDDHNPNKRRTLIEKALRQAGINQSCEFEASAYSWFRKSYSAHKYDKDKRPQGYIRPGHLLSQTAVHLTLRFQEDIPGPIVIGAGRHCGLGLFAPAD